MEVVWHALHYSWAIGGEPSAIHWPSELKYTYWHNHMLYCEFITISEEPTKTNGFAWPFCAPSAVQAAQCMARSRWANAGPPPQLELPAPALLLCRSHRSGPQKLMQSCINGNGFIKFDCFGSVLLFWEKKKHDGLSSRKPVGIPKVREVMICSGLKDFKSRMCWRPHRGSHGTV